MKDYYKILQVDPEASLDVLNNAYRALVRQWHPDLYHTRRKTQMHERMLEINEAYQVLQDPQRRAQYDASRRTAPSPPISALPAGGLRYGLRKFLLSFLITTLLLRFFLQPLASSPFIKILLGLGGVYLLFRLIRQAKAKP